MFIDKKTNEIVQIIDEWIRQDHGEDGHHYIAETYPHRILFMKLMNEIPISLKESKKA